MAKKGLDDHGKGLGRREVLECMVWAGTGVLWTVTGGIPHSVGLIGEAAAAEPTGFTFLQMSDSHIGFDKKANPDTLGTLREAVAQVKAMAVKPSFIIHTGDITHLSKPEEFDNADKVLTRPGSRFIGCPASTTLSMKSAARPILNATARAQRARAGTASTITAFTSLALSTSST